MNKVTYLKENKIWTTRSISIELFHSEEPAEIKKTERWINNNGLNFNTLDKNNLSDEYDRPAKKIVIDTIIENSRKKRKLVLYTALYPIKGNLYVLFANDGRNKRKWVFIDLAKSNYLVLLNGLKTLVSSENKDALILPKGSMVADCRKICRLWNSNQTLLDNQCTIRLGIEIYSHSQHEITSYIKAKKDIKFTDQMSHLDRLEAESIHIIREVISNSIRPVMLYSIGKDSSVMLHLARKAFYPSPPPFPLLHIDTCWKFQAMYDFRDYMAKTSGMDLHIHINKEGIKKNINPFDHGSALHTDIMKTQGLKQALESYKFDVAFGGARRDEEKSRAKERIFSFRTKSHHWDPKNQRPELWRLYNSRKNPDESIRVFPISNWTELDIWQYIYQEQIPIVPLYFAAERAIIKRDNMLMLVDDNRLKLKPNEKIEIKKIRFRTLGCYPLTGAIESNADDIASVVLETLNARTSERQGRMIDTDASASMEKKKQEGYF